MNCAFADSKQGGGNEMNPHHPLQHALELLLGATDTWMAAKTPKISVPRNLSLKTVLSAVEADASLPGMEQPAGLKGIQLHLYQRHVPSPAMDGQSR